MDNSDSEVDDLLSAIKEYYPNASVSVVRDIPDNDPDREIDSSHDSFNSLSNAFDIDAMMVDNEIEVNVSSLLNDHDYCSTLKLQEDKTIGNAINEPSGSNADEDRNQEVEISLPFEDKTSTKIIPVNKPPIMNQMENNSNINYQELEDENVDDPDWIPQSSSDIEEDNEVVIPSEDIREDDPDISIGRDKKKRKRKIHVDKSQWLDQKNKSLREKGKNYIGWQRKNNKGKRGPEREGRKIGPTCESVVCEKSDVRQCQSICENTRQTIFKDFWEKMSWDQKKVYIVSLVRKIEKKRTTKEEGEQSRRNFTYEYTIRLPNSNIVPVCKKMFLSTFGLKEWTVLSWVSNAQGQHHGIVPSKEFINSSRIRKRNTDKAKEILQDFLNNLPKLPSHYCRQSTSKVYVEPTGAHNISDVYREYQKLCKNHVDGPVTPVSRFTFDIFIHEGNISFQPPKKDRCDLCIAHEVENVNDVIYNEHIKRKDMARDEKAKDKIEGEKGKCLVYTQDLQSVKVCPSLNASALYYKTKLLCHNFTIYDINTGKASCYWFDETQGDLSANTYATCVIDYLSKHSLKDPKKPIILWSDGCTSQNRNVIFSNALLSFSAEHNIPITQKFLEKGHTQMEGDSVHSVIERKLKNKHIYLPSDYVRYTKSARENGAYETHSITFDFIKNFSVKELMVYDTIRPGKAVGDPTVTDLRVIHYSPSGDIKTKLSFDEEFKALPHRKKLATPPPLSSFPQLHVEPLRITQLKWKNLQELKVVLPADCHSYYDSLKYHESAASEKQQPPKKITHQKSATDQRKRKKKAEGEMKK